MSERKIKYTNHLEISEGNTKLVSSVLCPLKINELEENQLFDDNEGNDIVMCAIENQELKDGTYNSFCCAHFYGAIYPFRKNLIDCRHPNIPKEWKEK